MTQAYSTKKPASQDWHPAYVVAALRVAGWSLRRLAKHHGAKRESTLHNALYKRSPKGERFIAEAIGIPAAQIWPSRYGKESIAKEKAA